ncbi:MAG: hypothetical protein IPP80_00445 [Ignavibacteria bacterium]|nr:hypothetical protein [Ignavibacteria bacterium]
MVKGILHCLPERPDGASDPLTALRFRGSILAALKSGICSDQNVGLNNVTDTLVIASIRHLATNSEVYQDTVVWTGTWPQVR